MRITSNLWSLLVAPFAMALCASQLRGQASSDSTPAAVPELAGRWRLSNPLWGGSQTIVFRQSGRQLQGDLVYHVSCAGMDTRVQITLSGNVEGRIVRLRVIMGRLEGELGNPCAERIAFNNQQAFTGELSADSKTMSGPYDGSRLPSHTWTFSR